MRIRTVLGRAAAMTLILAGCGSAPGTDAASERGGASSLERSAPTSSDSIEMPAYPAPERGHLVTLSAGAFDLGGDWSATAGVCAEPPLLQVVATAAGIGAIILVQLPDSGNPVMTYPIQLVDSGLPKPPAAQIGVQMLQEGASGFQAHAGSVVVQDLGRHATGRFAVTLRETRAERSVKYAGVFDRIPVESLPPDECRRAREVMQPADSEMASPSR